MKKVLFFAFFIFSGFISVFAQQPTPSNTPVSQRTPDPAAETRRMIRQQEETNRRFDALRNGGNRANNNLSRTLAIQNINNIYRKPTKNEIELLAPNKEDLKKYAQFLRQSNTGLLKLIADKGCAENTIIVNASEDCLKYSMPGAGSSFSFRTANYRIRRLSDLTYTDDSFQSSGILAHAILVNVGDIPLEQISLQTKGLKFLTEFQTVTDFDKAKEIDRQFIEGIEKDGFIYRRGLFAKENTTYILRSIAYRGNYYRAIDGFLYDELDFDKRKDITIAFRIIHRDEESVTIIWKQLAEKDAPKVKRKNKEDSDVKENKFLAKTSDK